MPEELKELKNERIAELEAELEQARKERDTYLGSAQMMNRVSEKLLDLDDLKQYVQQLQAQPHTHDEDANGVE